MSELNEELTEALRQLREMTAQRDELLEVIRPIANYYREARRLRLTVYRGMTSDHGYVQITEEILDAMLAVFARAEAGQKGGD